ncbi:Gfo/Idh/MocA family protein [Tengunoibacter tsumagoiensis]|uniref:Dehydrogenase n=1 Tax=Tengunoibacter tsumagoiensis TaxID=2014871 RepID=A0A402A158_9CHLR|nr:Gfo/Idh/MocA family oxidoreductase [Tengunoibacter tsumagoiensis]GCE12877.1 dehydrogenase [Tengunoibacter tsumagoiensis]
MTRIGIIGAGPNAAGHARYFASSERSTVVAIADPDLKRAQELAAEIQSEAVPDYRDFIDRVDAVVISSPNFLHREHAIACAKAGKHIYCEKPMGLSRSDAEEIVAAVESAGVKSTVGFSVRFEPAMQTAQRFIREGKLGQLLSLCGRRTSYFNPADIVGWRANPRLSGGYLMEISFHELDWMLAFAGEVTSVYARTWSANSDDPRSNDHLWITLNFGSGAVGFHEGGWLAATPVFYRSILGTQGGVHTDEWGSILYHAELGQNREVVKMDEGFDLRNHFLDCIEGSAEPVADVAWGLKVMAVAEAVLESAASGQVVSLLA